MEAFKPSDVKFEEPFILGIDCRGGPIDKINCALRQPWSLSEKTDGRYVDASLGGANKSEATKREVLAYYRDAGWGVECVAGDRQGPDTFHFRILHADSPSRSSS